DPLSFEIARQPAHGTVTVGGSNVVYAPHLGYLGEDSFTFTAHDGQASSSPGLVSLRMTDQNTAPIAESYLLTVPMNRPTNVVLRAIDGENDPLQFTIVTNPAHGRFSGTAPNLIFTPRTNYYGPDRFAFTVHDGELQSAPGVVALSIVHPNTRPETTNQWLTAPLDAPVSFLLEVTDSDTNVLRAVILEGPRHGRVHGLGTNFVYTPRSGFTGSDSLTYRVWDGIAYSPIATVSINVQTTPPPTPPRFEALKLIDGGMLQMRIATMPGRLLRLEVSTDLVSWEPLLSQTPSTDTVALVDTNAPSLPRRFYRAVRLD
ncbi:MAG TPA: Ig-like domain-containing protein, partial [Verrucomicrobiota bacterium]|nr:Ig-like domain-containing protein [Verrucomicrobiota bacterium]